MPHQWARVTARGDAGRRSGREAEFYLEMQETLATSAPGNGVGHRWTSASAGGWWSLIVEDGWLRWRTDGALGER